MTNGADNEEKRSIRMQRLVDELMENPEEASGKDVRLLCETVFDALAIANRYKGHAAQLEAEVSGWKKMYNANLENNKKLASTNNQMNLKILRLNNKISAIENAMDQLRKCWFYFPRRHFKLAKEYMERFKDHDRWVKNHESGSGSEYIENVPVAGAKGGRAGHSNPDAMG